MAINFKQGDQVWWRGTKVVLRCTIEEYLGGTGYFIRVHKGQGELAEQRLYANRAHMVPYRDDKAPPSVR